MDANAVVQVGTNKAQFVHRIPHDVLKLTEELPCHECGGATLFVSRSLNITKEACRVSQRQLVMVCNQCSAKLTTGATVALEVFDRDLSKKMLKYQADLN